LIRGEHYNPVPNTPLDKRELLKELRDYAQRLDVVNALEAYGRALEIPSRFSKHVTRHAEYYLLELDPIAKALTLQPFEKNRLEEATQYYLEAEKRLPDQQPGTQVVLVSVQSLSALRRAYPNYFLDTDVFIQTVNDILTH